MNVTHETTVLVVGGGSTGSGVARDLALRGVDVTLVERDTLAGGTTGRSHGVLHSGARYALDDPRGARECQSENRVLREIAPHCLSETGGYVVQLPDDPPDHFDRQRASCEELGIETVVLSGEALRRREPTLHPDAIRAFAVNDGVVYPTRLTVATAVDAIERGARVLTGTTVAALRRRGDRVTGATIERGGRTGEVRAEYVVNAAGAWAARIASTAGSDLELAPTSGAMAVVGFDGLGGVLNRARPPSDGDIVVPHPGCVLLGTTSVDVDDPDDVPRRDSEIDRLFEEGTALLPDLDRARLERTFRGVRPLVAGDGPRGGRMRSRTFTVVDHRARDGIDGLVSILGGKLTTSRLMAEATADHVCERLDVDEGCATADVPLVGNDDPSALVAYAREFGARHPADEDVVFAPE